MGNLRRPRPPSEEFGFDRGTPVDRFHIEAFLASHSDDVRGRCLEVRDDTYVRRFGGDRVSAVDVVDVDGANPAATIVADLGVTGSLPPSRFDCVIHTQTLHYLADPAAGIDNVWQALAPGGTLLLTVPAIQRFHRWGSLATDLWRFHPDAVEHLLRARRPAELEVSGHGNLVVAVAALQGLAVEDLAPEDLARQDPEYPVVVTARAVKG